MPNKIILITGATSGIGFQTALALATMGAQVIITGRSQGSGEAALAEIKAASGNTRVDLLTGDLSEQANVRSLAGQFKRRYDRLDVLINNAGLAAAKTALDKMTQKQELHVTEFGALCGCQIDYGRDR